MYRSTFLFALLMSTSIATAVAAEPPFKTVGGMLVDRGGFAVYTFDKDVTPRVSTCYAQCAVLWPPVLGTASSKPEGEFTLSPRRDGSRQWAWRGKPLYRWVSDSKPGSATGEAVAGWHLVR